eukprot:jgi/Mesvir1/24712/Mv26005-RA.1
MGVKWAHDFKSYWRSRWNIFDFLLVAGSLLGAALSSLSSGPVLQVLRVLRALRVLRSIHLLAGLRTVVDTILVSVADMSNILILLVIMMFIWSVIGVSLFGHAVPQHFGNLGVAMYTLFVYLTQDGWVRIFHDLDHMFASGFIYSVSFIIIGPFIFMNLLVGIIVTNLQEAYRGMKVVARMQQERARSLALSKKSTSSVTAAAMEEKWSSAAAPAQPVASMAPPAAPSLPVGINLSFEQRSTGSASSSGPTAGPAPASALLSAAPTPAHVLLRDAYTIPPAYAAYRSATTTSWQPSRMSTYRDVATVPGTVLPPFLHGMPPANGIPVKSMLGTPRGSPAMASWLAHVTPAAVENLALAFAAVKSNLGKLETLRTTVADIIMEVGELNQPQGVDELSVGCHIEDDFEWSSEDEDELVTDQDGSDGDLNSGSPTMRDNAGKKKSLYRTADRELYGGDGAGGNFYRNGSMDDDEGDRDGKSTSGSWKRQVHDDDLDGDVLSQMIMLAKDRKKSENNAAGPSLGGHRGSMTSSAALYHDSGGARRRTLRNSGSHKGSILFQGAVNDDQCDSNHAGPFTRSSFLRGSFVHGPAGRSMPASP